MAVATENPIGPIQAILSSQAILITVIEIFKFHHDINRVQLIAFAFGMVGAFILVIPDDVFAFFGLSCC
jgi:drug/metabolite transporter (DMT)-like permease